MRKAKLNVNYYSTHYGKAILGDSLPYLNRQIKPKTVNLIMTSPPFGLVRKKDYGNAAADDYLEWFRPFAKAFKRILKDNGSLVIDIGGSWIPGQPTRSLYHFKLLIMLCEEFGFHLAQEFYWWNPAKLPTPAEWVTVRRIRVKDAINCIWWLSPTPWPRADNRRVLQPYSESMKDLLRNGYKAKLRPSGHDISDKFAVNNGAAIPPNLIALAHTESNSSYLRYCKQEGLKPHPARYPSELPEYFIRMLTDPGDRIVDPFAGSCMTGEVSERLSRKWICIETVEEYLRGSRGRFKQQEVQKLLITPPMGEFQTSDDDYYKIPRPGLLWNGYPGEPLDSDGGKKRRPTARKKESQPKDDVVPRVKATTA